MLRKVVKATYDGTHSIPRAAHSSAGDGHENNEVPSSPPSKISTEQTSEIREKSFVYDEPRPFLYRLFQLDLPESVDDEVPLSGRIASFTFDGDITEYFHTFGAAIREDRRKIMKVLSGTDGYIAVSYSWGTSPDRWPLYLRTVSCFLDEKGQVTTDSEPERHGYVWITPSARSFLLEMRRQKEQRFMWIDAICIQQTSELDKANQIPYMRELYASAEVVYVWLGESKANEQMALAMMPNVTEKLKVCQPANQDSLETAFEEAGLPEPEHALWRAYASILTRDWWSRLWTFQELAMADEMKNAIEYELLYKAPNAFVWCGKTSTRWDSFDFFAEALSTAGLKTWIMTGQQDVVWDHLHGLDAISEVRTGRESLLRYGWGCSLSALLVATRRRQARDPVDMVWGMYALLDKAARKDLALERIMSAQDVFIRFAKHYIRNKVKECLLNYKLTLEKLPGLLS